MNTIIHHTMKNAKNTKKIPIWPGFFFGKKRQKKLWLFAMEGAFGGNKCTAPRDEFVVDVV